MAIRQRTDQTKWLSYVFVVVATICLNTCSVYGSTTPLPQPGQFGCTDEAVAPLDQDSVCPRNYLRCENRVWRKSMCVGGIVNMQTGKCVPHTPECPESGVTLKTFSEGEGLRKKRQADINSTAQCDRSYYCPTDLQSIYIYPDWTDQSCANYIVCALGKQVVSTCKRDGYDYYNPSRLSCEEYASPTNICYYRLQAVLDPIPI